MKAACAVLARITPTLTAAQKTALISGYQSGLAALAQGGWLSQQESTRLGLLANQLDPDEPVNSL